MAWKYFFSIILYLNFADCCYNRTFLRNYDVVFKNDHMVVWFDPFVSLKDSDTPTKYNETLLTPLLQKVSTRFSAIMVNMTEDDLVGKFSDIFKN